MAKKIFKSAASQARQLAETVKIPGGDALQQNVINQTQQRLNAPPPVFTPTVSSLGTQTQDAVSQLLAPPTQDTTQQTIQTTVGPTDIAPPTSTDIVAPTLQAPTPVMPKTIEPFTPSKLEQEARTAGNVQAIQSIRDSLSARGLNQSEAGTFIEQKLLIDRNRQFARQDFNRTRQLVQEELQRSTFEAQQSQQQFNNQIAIGQLDVNIQQINERAKQKHFANQMAVIDFNIQANNSLFTQEASNRAFANGKENQLFNQKINTIQLATQQAGIQFNQEQIKFALDLQSSGLQLQDGLQLMALIQRGDLAAADIVAKGLAIDAQTKSSLFSSIGSLVGTLGGAAIGFLATGGNPIGAVAGASVGSSLSTA